MQNKVEIQEILQNSIAKVEFVKKDGSIRTMRCTLREDFLPKMDAISSKRKKSETSLSVWSVDDGGWRSFVVENVRKIEAE